MLDVIVALLLDVYYDVKKKKNIGPYVVGSRFDVLSEKSFGMAWKVAMLLVVRAYGASANHNINTYLYVVCVNVNVNEQRANVSYDGFVSETALSVVNAYKITS